MWITGPFGFVQYDMQAGEARWVYFDGKVSTSESTFRFNNNSLPTSVPLGPESVLAIDPGVNAEVRIDVTLFSSELDPTRSIAFDATGATLTDTTQDTVERFDASGLLQSVQKRTGATIVSPTYVPGTDRVATLVDGAGLVTSFDYDANNHLSSITDPSHQKTILVVNSDGDLASLTQPDGETYSFMYQSHRMTLKTSPDGDVTRYTYGADGTIATTSKPAAGDSYILGAAYSQPAQRDAQGHTIHVGSYTDPRGVVHTVTVDHHGQLATDAYVADGQSYVVQNVPRAAARADRIAGGTGFETGRDRIDVQRDAREDHLHDCERADRRNGGLLRQRGPHRSHERGRPQVP